MELSTQLSSNSTLQTSFPRPRSPLNLILTPASMRNPPAITTVVTNSCFLPTKLNPDWFSSAQLFQNVNCDSSFTFSLRPFPRLDNGQNGSQNRRRYFTNALENEKSAGDTHERGSGGRIIREVLGRDERTKINDSSDREFYAFPRLVKHVDDSFLSSLTQLYRERLPANGEILDLMSSWVSHLPPEVEYKRVVGHGLNASELARNPRLSHFFIKDLNQEPKLEASDGSFDAVICTVSVQYLQQPEKVFSEIYRILRPGGVVIVSFSNRMFFEKAIATWRDGSGYSRVQLVKQYFGCIQGFTEPEVITEAKRRGESEAESFLRGNPILDFVANVGKLLKRSSGDPFYAVVAYRNFRPLA